MGSLWSQSGHLRSYFIQLNLATQSAGLSFIPSITITLQITKKNDDMLMIIIITQNIP